MEIVVQTPVAQQSAESLPVGTIIEDSDGEKFVKVADDSWVSFEYSRTDDGIERYVTEPVTILNDPAGDK